MVYEEEHDSRFLFGLIYIVKIRVSWLMKTEVGDEDSCEIMDVTSVRRFLKWEFA